MTAVQHPLYTVGPVEKNSVPVGPVAKSVLPVPKPVLPVPVAPVEKPPVGFVVAMENPPVGFVVATTSSKLASSVGEGSPCVDLS